MHKGLLYYILAAVLFYWGCSPSARISRGDKYYNEYSYANALERYESVKDKTSPELVRKIAICYEMLQNDTLAEENYGKLVKMDGKLASDLIKHGNVLLRLQRYEEAHKAYRHYAKLDPTHTISKEVKKDKNWYKKIQKDEKRFEVKNLEVNTPQEDFGVIFYDDGVVFTSSREGVRSIRRKWNGSGLPFLDLYQASTTTDYEIVDEKGMKRKLNNKFHEGPATFSSKGDTMIFTRNNYEEKSEDGTRNLQLWQSVLEEDSTWSEPEPLKFNGPEFSVGHASLSDNGKVLYFSSDMPNGKGGVDLYLSRKQKDGTWSEPENLGDKVNSEGNEVFPFMHKDNVLFFSSNGHIGLGGLDVFYIRLDDKGKVIGTFRNAGVPVNSAYDDFSFIVDKKKKYGYFSSNRPEGKGRDDIYSYLLLKPFNFGKTVHGIVKDESGEPIAGAKVILYNSKKKKVAEVIADEEGNYSFPLEPNKKYLIIAKKGGYTRSMKKVQTKSGPDDQEVDLILGQGGPLSLYGIVKDSKNQQPITGVKVTIIDNITGQIQELRTKNEGDFIRNLKNKIGDRISYNLVFEKPGYLTKAVTYTKNITFIGKHELHSEMDLNLNKVNIGDDVGKILAINPIYFDYNKSAIRPDAAKELDKIVKVMVNNPSMEIELGSHTDCRGGKIYNNNLSSKRAKSSALYIKQRIPNPQRIYGKGYGESMLINRCECEGKRIVLCSEEQHQENRRTEFRIVKM